MDWDNHTNNVVNTAGRLVFCGAISVKISSSAIKERAYKAFARPILSVWDPYTQKSTDKLEAVQRRAARFVLNRYHTDTSTSSSAHRIVLDLLGWPSLEQRRKTDLQ